MAAKEGKVKKSVSTTLSLFSDFEENCKPEPSPSYFTELPVSYPDGMTTASLGATEGLATGTEGGGARALRPRDPEGLRSGVKLYFRPGLYTDAVKEGLQQALRHECTVIHIDLSCALQVIVFC